MATSQAASSETAAKSIRETVVGWHMLEIKGFPEDLGVGESIKCSTFHVGEHSWYIEFYTCGADDSSAGCVSIFLCLSSHHKEEVEAEYSFNLIDDDGWELLHLGTYNDTYNVENSRGTGSKVWKSYYQNDDSLLVRCNVSTDRAFPAVPPPDLHRPLSDLLASTMPGHLTFLVGGELFTVQRGLPGPSTHVPASPISSEAGRISSGSHVLTIDGYSKTRKMFGSPMAFVKSECFDAGGSSWCIRLFPSRGKEEDTDCLCLTVSLEKYHDLDIDELQKARFELTLLTFAREIISSAQFCYAFSEEDECYCYFPLNMETESLLGDSFHVKCDVTIVEEITPLRPPNLHRHFGDLLERQVGTDVEFEVGDDRFSAHKLVLATRSTAFMAKFFGLAGNASNTTVTRVRIDDMEPRVFKDLLHFIYTDALPEVEDKDKIVMAQGLLVAAERYAMAMERLKLICGDMLCCYIDDARTAITTLDLADKHGCSRLREVCKKFLLDHFAKGTP